MQTNIQFLWWKSIGRKLQIPRFPYFQKHLVVLQVEKVWTNYILKLQTADCGSIKRRFGVYSPTLDDARHRFSISATYVIRIQAGFSQQVVRGVRTYIDFYVLPGLREESVRQIFHKNIRSITHAGC